MDNGQSICRFNSLSIVIYIHILILIFSIKIFYPHVYVCGQVLTDVIRGIENLEAGVKDICESPAMGAEN